MLSDYHSSLIAPESTHTHPKLTCWALEKPLNWQWWSAQQSVWQGHWWGSQLVSLLSYACDWFSFAPGCVILLKY